VADGNGRGPTAGWMDAPRESCAMRMVAMPGTACLALATWRSRCYGVKCPLINRTPITNIRVVFGPGDSGCPEEDLSERRSFGLAGLNSCATKAERSVRQRDRVH